MFLTNKLEFLNAGKAKNIPKVWIYLKYKTKLKMGGK
jgi:hypothetical protein